MKKPSNINASILDDLEEKIRSGKPPKLKHLTETIKPKTVPRPLIARYASLLRRMGALRYALNLLNPFVRGGISKPTVPEIIEYASCLNRLGLEDEGISLLNEIKREPNPEIQFELAVANLKKWDYPASIPFLKIYINCPGLNSYKTCVGELNLAASYIYTDEIKKAEALLEKLLPTVKQQGFDLLWGNVLELKGEIAFLKQDFENASNFFRESGQKISLSNPRYGLYLDKWTVIIQMLTETGSKDSLARCAALRKKTTALRDWNTLKEIELFRAVVTNDSKTIANLYYGVPYLEFRKRILKFWGRPFKIKAVHNRPIGPPNTRANFSTRIFDVARGKDLMSGAQLKPGQTLHRLVQALASDFYAPFLTTNLFSIVFKGTVFNPKTAPQQIYEIVKRLNEWFITHKIPLSAQHGQGGYRLRANEPYILRTQSNLDFHSKLDAFLGDLKSHGLLAEFTVKSVAEKLDLPKRTVSRLISEGVSKGKLVQISNGPRTRYSFNLSRQFP